MTTKTRVTSALAAAAIVLFGALALPAAAHAATQPADYEGSATCDTTTGTYTLTAEDAAETYAGSGKFEGGEILLAETYDLESDQWVEMSSAESGSLRLSWDEFTLTAEGVPATANGANFMVDDSEHNLVSFWVDGLDGECYKAAPVEETPTTTVDEPAAPTDPTAVEAPTDAGSGVNVPLLIGGLVLAALLVGIGVLVQRHRRNHPSDELLPDGSKRIGWWRAGFVDLPTTAQTIQNVTVSIAAAIAIVVSIVVATGIGVLVTSIIGVISDLQAAGGPFGL